MYFQGETVDDDNPDALEDTKESEQKTDASFQDIKNIAELRRWFFFTHVTHLRLNVKDIINDGCYKY